MMDEAEMTTAEQNRCDQGTIGTLLCTAPADLSAMRQIVPPHRIQQQLLLLFTGQGCFQIQLDSFKVGRQHSDLRNSLCFRILGSLQLSSQ